MKVSLKNGVIERCSGCGLNHYKKKCIRCKKEFTTRNANQVKYCSKRCSKVGKTLSEEHKKKISKSLKKHVRYISR